MTDTPTDGELLRAADHDPHAFRLLYDRWAKPLLTFCYRPGDASAWSCGPASGWRSWSQRWTTPRSSASRS